MLGHRGCRLGITYPEITEMQARAIFEAAVAVEKQGIKTHAEVMIPLIATVKEMSNQGAIVRRVAEEVFKEKGKHVHYLVGTMIELPRACLVADEIAKEAEFFFVWHQRPDANHVRLLARRRQQSIADIFSGRDSEARSVRGDRPGWRRRTGTDRDRARAQDASQTRVGICGEHGGEPSSVEFCHQVGMDYVSCLHSAC